MTLSQTEKKPAKDIRKPPSEELNIFWCLANGEISKDNLKWNQHLA